ncbi:MAG TPA: right-handed parallel beta-helix repeat-containing protein [Acidimicrobiales bacterium]|nr:right-handed parallel beta-helix repeat-containing protein [Acidimicrobiales bacterium]
MPFVLMIAGAGMVGTASADPGGVPNSHGNGFGRPQVLQCGAQVTRSTKLAADIGPCVGTDGIDVVASGIRLDLNGHTITGADTTNSTNVEQIGVRLANVHGVDVSGPGTITKFDAGVGVTGGGGNLIRGLTVHDNISHVTFTGGVNPLDPEATACNWGDGIATDNSSHNTITHNTAIHNGPFGGISLVDASTSNTVSDNSTSDQTVANSVPDTDNDNDATNPETRATGDSDDAGPCGPFGANTTGPGREYQDIGIRMEGPGAANNVVTNNKVTGSDLDGISIFDNICTNNTRNVPPTAPNTGNLVEHNTVTDNGFAPGAYRDGIAVLQQGPAGVVCVPSDNSIVDNLSSGNSRDGIFMGGRDSHNNTINNNTVVNNGSPGSSGDGIQLTGPSSYTITNPDGSKTVVPLDGSNHNTLIGNVGHGNLHDDGFDGTPGCDSNNWANNIFVTVNQTCVDPSATVVP